MRRQMANAAPRVDDVAAEAAARTTLVAPTTARRIASKMVSNKVATVATVARSAGVGVVDAAAVAAVAETTTLRSR